MDLRVAVAKTPKYATSESGDTLEMIERPGGGLSFVLVDGQRSGRSAKSISNLVARKAISLLAEGVRDGAAARAASDYLFAQPSGKVVATLNILSVDLASRSVVVTRNNPDPVYLVRQGQIAAFDQPSLSVGTRRDIRPVINEIALEPGLVLLAFTDGLTHAGDRKGSPLAIRDALTSLIERELPVDRWADELLRCAVELDDGRPGDDISVLVLTVQSETGDEVRRLWVRMPL
ncbi:MAG: SpoIIE family protein phosphatase [Anaerolineales bacterium]|jgi:serine phosphatase RsbU (regulator of sigma subunit)